MAKFIVTHGIRIATEWAPEQFGALTTIGPTFRLGIHSYQVCQCQCGTVSLHKTNTLRTHKAVSCGCVKRKTTVERNFRHGAAKSPEWCVWTGLRARCKTTVKPDAKWYTHRGIQVCARWQAPNGQGFVNFLADMGPRPSDQHSIDRIDPNGDYCPENCRWATMTQQSRNKTTTRWITYNGDTRSAAEWAEITGIPSGTIRRRLALGWPPDKALTTPVKANDAVQLL